MLIKQLGNKVYFLYVTTLMQEKLKERLLKRGYDPEKIKERLSGSELNLLPEDLKAYTRILITDCHFTWYSHFLCPPHKLFICYYKISIRLLFYCIKVSYDFVTFSESNVFPVLTLHVKTKTLSEGRLHRTASHYEIEISSGFGCTCQAKSKAKQPPLFYKKRAKKNTVQMHRIPCLLFRLNPIHNITNSTIHLSIKVIFRFISQCLNP